MLAVTFILVIAALAIVAAVVLISKYKTYKEYSVQASLAISNLDKNLGYISYVDGYIKYDSRGVTYFDKDGIRWDENFEMAAPIVDVDGEYIAAADMKQSDVYIYDTLGFVGRLNVTYAITDLEVSRAGIVAVATSDNNANYIKVMDIDGHELINAKSIFSASGYLADIALSEDGTKLAAAFIYVSKGTLESKVLFYDFSEQKVSDDILVGGFNQYTSTVLTNVEFMAGDVVCAIGDDALTFYDFSGTPTIIYEELKREKEIQSLYVSRDYLAFVYRDETGQKSYIVDIMNTKGEVIGSVGYNKNYEGMDFAGKNIMIYSDSSCELYSFSGLLRYSGSFDNRVEAMAPYDGKRTWLLASGNKTEFIKLK